MTVKTITMTDVVELMHFSEFVRNHPCCHFLQEPWWGRVKDQWKWQGIVVYDANNAIVGAVSVLCRALPLGFTVLYAPRGPVCDRNDPEVMDILLDTMRSFAKSRNALLLYIDPDVADNHPVIHDIMKRNGFSERSSTGFGNIQPQYVFRLDIAGRSEEEILGCFSQKTRYNIRLAGRRGVTVTRYFGNEIIPDAALDSFTRLMETTGKRDRFITRGRAYFERLLSVFGKDAALFLASVNGENIAGTIGIFYGNKAWYLYGASANEHRACMPNYLLQWEMIRYACQCGCEIYDFRGVPGKLTEGEPLYGLYRFKKGFGGVFTKFTGLFVYPVRPVLGRLFVVSLSLFRKLRSRMRT